MENKKYYKEQSKLDWYTTSQNLSLEQLNTGAILRIADATEKMASNYISLQNDRDWYKRKYNESYEENKRLSRVISGLRGYLKRIKK